MALQELSAFSKRFTILTGLTVVGLMACGLALSFYRNVLFEQTLQDLAQANEKLRGETGQKRLLLDYYGSRRFKDKIAKESFGLLQPGEKVLILTSPLQRSDDVLGDEPLEQERRDAAYREYLQHVPTLEHWKLFLFHREELQNLQGSF